MGFRGVLAESIGIGQTWYVPASSNCEGSKSQMNRFGNYGSYAVDLSVALSVSHVSRPLPRFLPCQTFVLRINPHTYTEVLFHGSLLAMI